MNIVVLIKQVPDTASNIQNRVTDGGIDLEGVTWITNPYDEYGVEEAMRLKEAHGGSVTLIGLGPERVDSALKEMLALGADEAIRVWDPAFEGLGARGRAAVLAATIAKLPEPPDMIWAGWKGVDEDQGLVPIYLAHALGLPHLSFVVEIEVEGDTVRALREVEGGKERLEAPLPAILTAQKGLNEVRYASLKGIMAVKRKQIPVWDTASIGIQPEDLPTASVETLSVDRPPERAAGRLVEGEPAAAAAELVRLLNEEAKVI